MGANANAAARFLPRQITIPFADPGGAGVDIADYECWMPPAGGAKILSARLFTKGTAFAAAANPDDVAVVLKQGSTTLATCTVVTNLAAGASQAFTINSAEVSGGTVVKLNITAGPSGNAPEGWIQIEWTQDGLSIPA